MFKHEVFSPNLFSGACADEMISVTNDFLSEKGRCSLVLSGGGTPVAVFRTLTIPPRSEDTSWKEVDYFFGDERWVPESDAQSNFKMAHDTLLAPLSVPANRIHKIDTSLADPDTAASHYSEEISEYFRKNDEDSLDLLLLGLGDDGHTASLFPGSPLLDDQRLVGACRHPQTEQWRISLLPELILRSKKILVMVKGIEKSSVVAEVFKGGSGYPVSILDTVSSKVTWFLDSDAASQLSRV